MLSSVQWAKSPPPVENVPKPPRQDHSPIMPTPSTQATVPGNNPAFSSATVGPSRQLS